jgi:hypothetical protein
MPTKDRVMSRAGEMAGEGSETHALMKGNADKRATCVMQVSYTTSITFNNQGQGAEDEQCEGCRCFAYRDVRRVIRENGCTCLLHGKAEAEHCTQHSCHKEETRIGHDIEIKIEMHKTD